jgi:ketosteroid isomerase-like protein
MAANEDTVRRWFEAVSAEDFDAAMALVHRDVVVVPPGAGAPHRGADAMRRWIEPDVLRDQVLRPLEIVVGETTALARQCVSARGRASGIELDVISWTVWTFDDDGLVTRLEIYLDHEEERAREAAGLPAQ